MIEPRLCSSHGTARLESIIPEITLVSKASFRKDSVYSATAWRYMLPALLTSTSSLPPPWSAAAASIATRSVCTVTSPATARQPAPIDAATASTFAARRPLIVTFAPRAANSRAMPSPSPEPPPVTSTDMPFTSRITQPPRRPGCDRSPTARRAAAGGDESGAAATSRRGRASRRPRARGRADGSTAPAAGRWRVRRRRPCAPAPRPRSRRRAPGRGPSRPRPRA